VIVGRAVSADDIKKMNGEVVCGGFTVGVAKGEISMKNKNVTSKLTKTDIGCTNGTIHAIDSVLIPE
jgi:uncharacterized surface protein with fasciclin (FAS1) repeats